MLYCEVQGMGYGLGFLLFVDGGAPAALEIFSHCNEAIPEHISFYEHIWSCFPNCASVTHVMGTA
ncbi:hypothetical protein DL1_20510 [Thioclava dalianensis]|uniref:Uncharacterized protein n=2 Tax=Thioclava dalianensis TaxID=1185766 RepID=A0A074TE66_9RHOB|nr:hypothetical protein DL1_20510 [Thioclava dalianensis]